MPHRILTLFIFKAIIGFRETERKQWNRQNSEVIARIKAASFDPSHKILPYVHILDLKEDGFIKPHVDSSRVRSLNKRLLIKFLV